MAWDEPVIEKLKELWLSGRSAAACAQAINGAFGTSFSRNAVIGKCHRMGLRRQEPAASYKTRWVQKPKTPRVPKTPAARRDTAEAVAMVKRIARNAELSVAPLPEENATVASSNPVAFQARVFGQCAAPVSGTGFDMIVCGNECQDGQSYCPGHRAIYYRPFVTKDRDLLRLAKRFA